MTDSAFKRKIWKHYEEQGRKLPWRHISNPYKILLSETMLQQTQVARVMLKYKSFLKKFPTLDSLAKANLSDVLIEWQGLGYNSRAKNLKKTAEIIMNEYKGKFPKDHKTLLSLPGIGQSTAGALMSFAFNMPVVFIETNIRAVYIHFFFSNKTNVHDKEILPLILKTLDQNNPREWYYALMDYGVMLKATIIDPARKSKHYKKQSKFIGSNRQKRSVILQTILKHPHITKEGLKTETGYPLSTINTVLMKMKKEGLVDNKNNTYYIS